MNGALLSLAAFAFAIGVLVTVHEFGHFWVARRVGVKVLRFPSVLANRCGGKPSVQIIPNWSLPPFRLAVT